ncbi:MAG: DUF3341 domain-containing protein [Fimbriimonadales bacterium]
MHHPTPTGPQLYGVVAEYSSGEAVVAAANAARAAGFTKMDAYTPYMVDDLVDALGNKDDRVPKIVFGMGLLGATGGFLLQWWVASSAYPLNIGGRPNLSWPSFIPITFECGVLVAALTAAGAMIALNGLPRPHHPIFDAKNIERATKDKFFLCIEAEDPAFDLQKAKDVLGATKADDVSEVHS